MFASLHKDVVWALIGSEAGDVEDKMDGHLRVHVLLKGHRPDAFLDGEHSREAVGELVWQGRSQP